MKKSQKIILFFPNEISSGSYYKLYELGHLLYDLGYTNINVHFRHLRTAKLPLQRYTKFFPFMHKLDRFTTKDAVIFTTGIKSIIFLLDNQLYDKDILNSIKHIYSLYSTNFIDRYKDFDKLSNLNQLQDKLTIAYSPLYLKEEDLYSNFNKIREFIAYDTGIYTTYWIKSSSLSIDKWYVYTSTNIFRMKDPCYKQEVLNRVINDYGIENLVIDKECDNPAAIYKGFINVKFIDNLSRLPNEFLYYNKPVIAYDMSPNMKLCYNIDSDQLMPVKLDRPYRKLDINLEKFIALL